MRKVVVRTLLTVQERDVPNIVCDSAQVHTKHLNITQRHKHVNGISSEGVGGARPRVEPPKQLSRQAPLELEAFEHAGKLAGAHPVAEAPAHAPAVLFLVPVTLLRNAVLPGRLLSRASLVDRHLGRVPVDRDGRVEGADAVRVLRAHGNGRHFVAALALLITCEGGPQGGAIGGAVLALAVEKVRGGGEGEGRGHRVRVLLHRAAHAVEERLERHGSGHLGVGPRVVDDHPADRVRRVLGDPRDPEQVIRVVRRQVVVRAHRLEGRLRRRPPAGDGARRRPGGGRGGVEHAVHEPARGGLDDDRGGACPLEGLHRRAAPPQGGEGPLPADGLLVD
mmetsp:Transcript_28334/g.71286  ORF Transcript_28334/g.71286 Transcript_28334/m.71286 type:complete len:336 (-) Transcript_28334:337-1344(-)